MKKKILFFSFLFLLLGNVIAENEKKATPFEFYDCDTGNIVTGFADDKSTVLITIEDDDFIKIFIKDTAEEHNNPYSKIVFHMPLELYTPFAATFFDYDFMADPFLTVMALLTLNFIRYGVCFKGTYEIKDDTLHFYLTPDKDFAEKIITTTKELQKLNINNPIIAVQSVVSSNKDYINNLFLSFLYPNVFNTELDAQKYIDHLFSLCGY